MWLDSCSGTWLAGQTSLFFGHKPLPTHTPRARGTSPREYTLALHTFPHTFPTLLPALRLNQSEPSFLLSSVTADSSSVVFSFMFSVPLPPGLRPPSWALRASCTSRSFCEVSHLLPFKKGKLKLLYIDFS